MKADKHKTAWEAIVRRIREKSAEPGENQSSLARLLGVNRATIGRWLSAERGGKKASLDDMLTYMRRLGIDAAQYFGETASEYIHVPWMEAEASMGGGSTVVNKTVISHLGFRADWLLAKGSPKNMAVINAHGGSMEPTIPDESIVLINEAKAYPPVNGKIYFVFHQGELFLKRLKVRNGRVEALISDCDNSEIAVHEDDEFEIIGRALWFAKEL